MYGGQTLQDKECTGTDITIERNVMLRNDMGTDITSEMIVQGTDKQTLEGMYRDIHDR